MRFKPCRSYLLIPALLLAVSTCARPRTSTDGPRNRGEPFILVSALGASAVFPAESMRHWGWDPAIPMRASAPHVWEARVDGVDGTWAMRWQVRRVQSAKPAHSSLAALLEHGEGSLCRLEYGPVCEPVAVGAIARGERVSLGIADSAAVVRMFGDRPRWATFVRAKPGLGAAQILDSIPIEYVEPRVAELDSASRSRATRTRRGVLTAATQVTRHMAAGPSDDGPLWIGVGDTVTLKVIETRCRDDRCLDPVVLTSIESWRSDDPAVASIVSLVDEAPGRALLVGTSKGRTTLRVSGLRGEADTLFDGAVAPREAVREVIVAEPIQAVWLRPRPDTVVLGQPIRFRIYGEDRLGELRLDVPSGVNIHRGTYLERQTGSDPSFSFDTPGEHTIVVYAGMRAETLGVTVLAERPMKPVAEYASDLPHVLVSAEEARFIFRRVARPKAGWGWGVRERGAFNWAVWLDGVAGRRVLQVRSPHVEGPALEAGHMYSSLRHLLASMEAVDCHPNGSETCQTHGLSARVEDGRVVLSLRDRVAIERFFRTRPGWVELDETFPGDTTAFPEDVTVTYVDPQIPLPDREFHAWAARQRSTYLSDETWIERVIAGGGYAGYPVQMTAGDTMELTASEGVHVGGELRGGGLLHVREWSVDDSNIVAIVAEGGSERQAGPPGSRARMVARASGSTIVRATGLRGAADTLLTPRPPTDAISRRVLVTPRLSRVVLAPRPEEVRVGDTVRFELQAFDVAGAHVPLVPGSLVLERENWSTTAGPSASRAFGFEQAGTYRVIGRIGVLADTVIVVARDR